MRRSVLNRAIIGVTNTTDASGRVTADEVNLDRFRNRIGKVRLIARTWLASVTVSLGLYLGLSVCGLAQNDQGQNDQGFLDPMSLFISHTEAVWYKNSNFLGAKLVPNQGGFFTFFGAKRATLGQVADG